MLNNEKTTSIRQPFVVSWPTTLSLLTALFTVGAVALHLIGDLSHRQYLNYWGIDAGLFPKTTDWILINGYYGVVERFVAILIAMLHNLHWLGVAALILGVYLFILLSPTGASPAWLMRQSEWQRRLIRQLLITALFVSLAPFALFLVTAIMVVPAALGETAGKAAAEKEALEYRKGCQTSKMSCVELKKEGQTIVTGFVLDTSPSHIAIFDAQLQRGRVLSRDNLEVMSSRTPQLKVPVVP